MNPEGTGYPRLSTLGATDTDTLWQAPQMPPQLRHQPHNGKPEASVIERVGVVGVGQMGSGIAEVCARGGLDVIVADEDAEGLKRGRDRIAVSLKRAVKAGKLT